MADKPKLVGPDGHVPDGSKALHTAMTEKMRVQMAKPATEGRVAELVTAGMIAGLDNIQSYFVRENSRMFEDMEQIAVDRVLAEIRRRSLRGRLETRYLLAKEYCRGWLIEFGAIDPTSKPGHIKLEPTKNADETGMPPGSNAP